MQEGKLRILQYNRQHDTNCTGPNFFFEENLLEARNLAIASAFLLHFNILFFAITAIMFSFFNAVVFVSTYAYMNISSLLSLCLSVSVYAYKLQGYFR